MQAKLSTDNSGPAYRVRGVRILALTAVFVLLPTAAAWAHDNGEGLVGETDDKIVTFFSLGVIVFFVLVVITGSAIQSYLERRKEAQKALDLRRRVGW
jgi:uncharacterized membrane protein YphA (DoxX/SURF4 family)